MHLPLSFGSVKPTKNMYVVRSYPVLLGQERRCVLKVKYYKMQYEYTLDSNELFT